MIKKAKLLVEIEPPGGGESQIVTEKAFRQLFKNRGYKQIGEPVEADESGDELSDRRPPEVTGTFGAGEVSAATVARNLGLTIADETIANDDAPNASREKLQTAAGADENARIDEKAKTPGDGQPKTATRTAKEKSRVRKPVAKTGK